MKLRQVADLLNLEILCCKDRVDTIEIETAYACDLMSDVLAFCKPTSLLMTGLTNIQIVRTAQMLDIPAIVFVRGKLPQPETLALAEENGIPVLVFEKSMYEACGILYKEGLPPCTIVQRKYSDEQIGQA